MRYRGDAIRPAVEIERLVHPGRRRGSRPDRLAAQQAVGDRRARSRRCRARSRASARRPRSAPGWRIRSRSSTRSDAHPGGRGGVRPRPRRRTTSAPPTCASWRSRPASRDSASGRRDRDGAPLDPRPHARRRSSTASSARRSSSAPRAAASRSCSGARSRSASASRSARARTSGHAAHGAHGPALLRVHRTAHGARLTVRLRALRGTPAGPRLAARSARLVVCARPRRFGRCAPRSGSSRSAARAGGLVAPSTRRRAATGSRGG